MSEGPKFYQKKEFKKLHSEWMDRLAKDGFEDHENRKEELKQHDRRTISWQNQLRIKNFYDEISEYLSRHELDIVLEGGMTLKAITALDCPVYLKVLLGISEGFYLSEISIAVGRDYSTVREVIYEFKRDGEIRPKRKYTKRA